MRVALLFLLAAAAAFAADDAWSKVKALKTGVEIRVYKRGSTQPVAAQMGELTDENLQILVKNSQTAIPRDQIDRIDARPAQASRVTTQSTTKETYPDAKSAAPSPRKGRDVPGTSTSSTVTIGSKPDFETVYRRLAAEPKKPEAPK